MIVAVYVPAVVPCVLVVVQPVLLPPPPPPQAITPSASAASSNTIPSIALHLRRFSGAQKRSKHASTAPPGAYHGIRCGSRFDAVHVPLLADSVFTVNVAVAGLVPEMVTGLVAPKLKVGAFTEPVGLPVIAALNVTEPVKPPAGVTVTVEAFPVAAPAVTVTAVPVTVKPGGTDAVTVTGSCALPDA